MINKTPIQELIDYIDDLIMIAYSQKNVHTDSISHNFELLRDFINKFYRQKEKAFAFDCFKTGQVYGMDVALSIEWAEEPTKPDFDQFYSQYAEQHTN